MTITETDLADFCAAVEAKIAQHAVRTYPKYHETYAPAVSFEIGKKWARIVKGETIRATGAPGSSRSAFCFVDLENGDILKADGWKRPARHPRGNIRNGAADVSPYGPASLR